ncbi:two-component sensor histidine kinase [Alishewanella longhuensis]|uniref:histidine kinase n=2 Tax=Alishewanella longhuensis TaxID=1091037 RepID=A0ABQ3L2D9_9ALTE|nr:two-component sensor histidine kinase [Alishewanella longhuensis]
MYLRKLAISLCVLLAIILLQSAIAFWAHQNSEFHTERNRVANQMLSEFVSVRADKQRLKVWLAEYLITEDANTSFRDALFNRMQQQLNQLDQLAIRDQLLSTSEIDLQHTMQQVKVISLLQSNLQTLEQALRTREIALYQDDTERWRVLISLFDKFQDTDLSELLQQAIVQQKERASITELEALAALQQVKLTIALISLAGLIFAIFIGYHLSKALSRPLQQLLDGTKQLQHGHFNHRISESGPEEFAELARQFNLMSGYIAEFAEKEKQSQQAAEQLVQDRTAQLQQALEQLHEAEYRQKQLLADISHELRTPATSIQGEAEISLRGQAKTSSEYQEAFSRILAATQQLSRRIDDLLMLARGEDKLLQVQLQPLALTLFIQQAQNTVRQQLEPVFTIDWHCNIAITDDYWLLLDTEKFASVLRIITENTKHYARNTSQVRFSIKTTDAELIMELVDQGIGITIADSSRLFERHYRSAVARQTRPDGLGIGLCIAKAIMDAHDGAIALSTNQPTGTRVTLTLPLFSGVIDESSHY